MSQTLNTYKLQKTVELKIGKIYFYDFFLITEINEGITVGLDEAKEISKMAIEYYKEQPIGYISNRINSYAVVPVSYLKIKEIFPTIKAFATVIYSEMQNDVIEVENNFLNGMLKSFRSLDQAIEWTQLKLKK